MPPAIPVLASRIHFCLLACARMSVLVRVSLAKPRGPTPRALSKIPRSLRGIEWLRGGIFYGCEFPNSRLKFVKRFGSWSMLNCWESIRSKFSEQTTLPVMRWWPWICSQMPRGC